MCIGGGKKNIQKIIETYFTNMKETVLSFGISIIVSGMPTSTMHAESVSLIDLYRRRKFFKCKTIINISLFVFRIVMNINVRTKYITVNLPCATPCENCSYHILKFVSKTIFNIVNIYYTEEDRETGEYILGLTNLEEIKLKFKNNEHYVTKGFQSLL